jgi:C4-dicarboxylate transporter DctM subunit
MGIIFIVNLEIGYVTPPVGLNLFVSSSLFKKSIGFVIKSVLQTLGIMLVSLMCITWVPSMSLGLVELLKAKPAAPAKPVTPLPQPEAAPSTGDGKVKSMQELMREAQEKQGGEGQPSGEAPRVKSMQELMREAQEKAGGDEGAQAPAPQEPPRLKSMQELMREAKEREAATGDEAQ